MTSAPDHDRAPDFIRSWAAVLRRRWRTGAAVSLAILGVAVLVLVLARPIHRAEAVLRLGEPPPMGSLSQAGSWLGFFQLGGDPFANDMELLASRTLAQGVVRDVALNVHVSAPPGWYRDSLFTRLAADTSTIGASFELEWEDGGGLRVRMEAPEDTAEWSGRPGDPLHFAGVTLVARPWREEMPRTVTVSTRPFAEAVRSTRSRIRTERARLEANVLEIAFEDPDPGIAREVTESVVERFVELRTAINQRESLETVDSLRVVSAQTLEELAQAEASMEELQRRTRMVTPDAQSEVFIEEYAELAARLQQGRSELMGIDSILQRVDRVENPAEAWTSLAAYPRFLENETVGQFLRSLTALEQRRTQLSSRRTVETPEYRVVQEQIAFLDQSLRHLAREYRRSLAEQLTELEGRVARMDRTLASMPGQALELGRRQRDVRILSEVLVVTEQRLRQEQLRQALTFANVQVIDPPALLPRPVSPRRKLGLLVGLVLASTLGLVGMVVAERVDDSVRSAEVVRGLTGVPVLGAALPDAAGRPSLSPEEVHGLFARSGREGEGGLTLVPVDPETDAEGLAATLGAALRESGRDAETVTAGPVADRYSATAEVARRCRPAVLVLTYGRSTAADLERARRHLEEADKRPIGAVVLCRSPRQVEALWG